MPDVTFFTIPKPFTGQDAIAQANAIRSWTLLKPAPEVILFGNEEGIMEAAAALGVRHAPTIARSSFGTPLVGDAFNTIESMTEARCLCYINADIVLLSDFPESLDLLLSRQARFLMAGRRWNVDLAAPLDFGEGWEARLREQARDRGSLYGAGAMDYFAYTRGIFGTIPAFAVGRPGWDNWLVYQARFRGIPLIDATATVMAIHQNHGYAHVPERGSTQDESPEARENLRLVGGRQYVFTLDDATHRLTPSGIRPAFSPHQLRIRLSRMPVLHPWTASVYYAVRKLYRKFHTARKSSAEC